MRPIVTHRNLALGFIALISLSFLAPAAAERRKVKPAHELALGQLINNVRYGQSASALKFLDGPAQGAVLLGETWAKASPEDQARFLQLFHHLFAGVAFPKMRDSFQYLTTITYTEPKPAGAGLTVGSVLHIQAGPKEQELKVEYQLSKGADGALKVVDVTLEGEPSMLTGIRDEQIKPILADGGLPRLLELLAARTKDLPPVKDEPLKK